jgi:hypothetical protein
MLLSGNSIRGRAKACASGPDGHALRKPLAGELSRLRRQVASDLLVQPMFDLYGQIQDLDRHSVVSGSPGLSLRPKPTGHPISVSDDHIAGLDDRFQYLLFNNP